MDTVFDCFSSLKARFKLPEEERSGPNFVLIFLGAHTSWLLGRILPSVRDLQSVEGRVGHPGTATLRLEFFVNKVGPQRETGWPGKLSRAVFSPTSGWSGA